MNNNELITSMLLTCVNQKQKEATITGNFSEGVIYRRRYLKATTKVIAINADYALYFIAIPNGAKKITVNHIALTTNIYGMGFTKYASDTTSSVAIVSCYNRMENPKTIDIPDDANFFVISATEAEIDSCNYTFYL